MNSNNDAIKSKSNLRKISFAVIVLVAAGFLLDLFNGFYVLSRSKSIYTALFSLLILGIFYLIGEAGSEWICGKDSVEHPLYKRVFLLLALLLFAGLVMTALWFVLKYLGLIRI